MKGPIELAIAQTVKDLSPEQLAKVAFPIFRDGRGQSSSQPGTPKLSGNARRNTKLSGNKILAQYAYAQRLDKGYSGKAPDGMTKPTEEYMKDYIEKYAKDH